MTGLPRRAQNRLEREKAILDAALGVFSSAGFSGATMEAVATAAGISKPTLYQYFPNKTALFTAMMETKRNHMLLAFETSDCDDLVPRLVRFAMSYAQTVMRPDMLSLARLIIGEAQRFPEIGRRYQAAGPDPLLEGVKAYLLAQKQAGRLIFEDAETAAEDLWGLILSGPRNRALHDPEFQMSQADLMRSVFHGLQVFLRAYSAHPARDLAALETQKPRSLAPP